MPFREMDPGVQPEDTEQDCKKTIDDFSGDCSNSDGDEKKAHRQQAIERDMNDSIPTSNEGFPVDESKNEPSNQEQEIRQHRCWLEIGEEKNDHEENCPAQSDEKTKAPGTPDFFPQLNGMMLKFYAGGVMTLERSFHLRILIFFFVGKRLEISSYPIRIKHKGDTNHATENEQTSDPEFLDK